MTEYEIRADGKILIKGYVNAVGRDSNPVYTAEGRAVEQIEPGAFAESLKNRSEVDVLLNHRADRKLASTTDNTAVIYEDNIGLRAEILTDDEDVKYKVQNGLLSGWSFGFYSKQSEMEQRADQIPRRHVKKLDMYEISIIDNTMTPCYAGTSIEYRADEIPEYRSEKDEFSLSKEVRERDLEEKRAWTRTKILNARINAYKNLPEVRYNPYHDPKNGRFTNSSGGGTGGYLYVGKGEKGKGVYVTDRDNFDEDDITIEGLLSAEGYKVWKAKQYLDYRQDYYKKEYPDGKPNGKFDWEYDFEKKRLATAKSAYTKAKNNRKKVFEKSWINDAAVNYLEKLYDPEKYDKQLSFSDFRAEPKGHG